MTPGFDEKGPKMRFTAISCIIALLLTAPVWAESTTPGGNPLQEIHWGSGCDCVFPCYPACDPPPSTCAPQKCKPACQPQCNTPCKPGKPPEPQCEERCEFGMDAIMGGAHELLLIDEGVWNLDPACCELDEFRLLPCREWCTEFSLCCPREEFRLLCQPECEVQCPPFKKCKQDICTPASGCASVDTSEGLEI